MTIGITPTRPETGYGYLRLQRAGQPRGRADRAGVQGEAVARGGAEYVESGSYLWNASMFLLAHRRLPRRARRPPARRARPDPDDRAGVGLRRQEAVLAEAWPTVPKVAVEYAVMEPAATEGKVATVPGDFGWNDIGDFETLGELLGRDIDGSRVVDVTGSGRHLRCWSSTATG